MAKILIFIYQGTCLEKSRGYALEEQLEKQLKICLGDIVFKGSQTLHIFSSKQDNETQIGNHFGDNSAFVLGWVVCGQST